MLDAGALQALERRHLRLLVDLRRAYELGLPVRIPAGALAQSWRGGPRSATIARLLKQPCTVVPFQAEGSYGIPAWLGQQDVDAAHWRGLRGRLRPFSPIAVWQIRPCWSCLSALMGGRAKGSSPP